MLIGTAAVLSVVALAACEDQNTAVNGDTRDQVATTQPANPPRATVDLAAKDAGVTSNAPAELTSDTREYVQTAAMGDMFEVEASRVALSRSKSAEVKKFAREMIDAHTKTSDDLKARLVRAGLIVELPTTLDDEHQKELDDHVRTAKRQSHGLGHPADAQPCPSQV